MAEHKTQIALGIVIDGDNVLLIERQQREIGCNGKPIVWAFPGGKLENQETAMAAAVREVGEETGYLVEAIETITAESHPQYPVYAHCV